MTFRLQKIDELSINDHYHLVDSDECWYFGEYTAYKDWSFSDTNKLIKNFKKKMHLAGTNQWPYKLAAINKIGKLFASAINPNNLEGIIFVPIPPSKIIGDPEYDPRVRRSLDAASNELKVQLPIYECISQTQNTCPDHESNNTRLYPEDRASTYQLKLENVPSNTKCIVLVDDMLTTGSHFKGAELAIKQQLPKANIIGLFVARRVHEFPPESFDITELM